MERTHSNHQLLSYLGAIHRPLLFTLTYKIMDRDQADKLLTSVERIATSLEDIANELPTVGVTTEVGITGMTNLCEQLELLNGLTPIAKQLTELVDNTGCISSYLGDIDGSIGSIGES